MATVRLFHLYTNNAILVLINIVFVNISLLKQFIISFILIYYIALIVGGMNTEPDWRFVCWCYSIV